MTTATTSCSSFTAGTTFSSTDQAGISQWEGREVSDQPNDQTSQLVNRVQKRKELETAESEPKKLKRAPLDENVLSEDSTVRSCKVKKIEGVEISEISIRVETLADLLRKLPDALQVIAEAYIDDLIIPLIGTIKEDKEIDPCLIRYALRMTSLDIKNEELSDQQIAKLLGYFRNLEYLMMAKGVTNIGLEAVSQLKNLCVLDLSNCDKITDDGMAFLSDLKNLQELNLSGCKITDKGLPHLAKPYAFKLKELDVGEDNQITEEGGFNFGILITKEKLARNEINIGESFSWKIKFGPKYCLEGNMVLKPRTQY